MDWYEWNAIAGEFEGTGPLLVGNGASVALWSAFDYTSLFQVAMDSGLLGAEHQPLFDIAGGKDFEAVLRNLHIARSVSTVFGQPTNIHDQRSMEVRNALRSAVVETHIPWTSVTQAQLAQIRNSLACHSAVFSTNYDLLLYWAMMSVANDAFKDLFWGPGSTFNAIDTDVTGGAIPVFWLHGGAHLIRGWDGRTRKRTSAAGNLIATFGDDPDSTPLMITEGTGAHKLKRITESDYLHHCYRMLADPQETLTIVGSSLNAVSDSHLLEAVGRAKPDRIAVSLFQPTAGAASQLWGRIVEVVGHEDVRVFDASTHPLCAF